ncbi:MAG: DUF1080 domain-containing protein [Cyclobacteriaceae bacterium]
MKTLCAGLVMIFAIISPSPDQRRTKSLFNGRDLKGWDTYLGPPYDTLQKKFTGKAPGLNADHSGVFTVAKTDGKGAIRISGEHFGGISTQEAYEKYHLRLEFKWGEKKWHPKKNSARDSGLLYHAVGRHAGDGNFWMRSQEFQIQEGDCGDYWGVAGAFADIPVREKSENQYLYDPTGPLLTFRDKTPIGRHCIKNPDAEKTSGEWNTIDLYCMGDTSVHVVNGVVNMVLYNLRQESADGSSPLTNGKIQIQSEGAEIFYRNITIDHIQKIPQALLPRDPQ